MRKKGENNVSFAGIIALRSTPTMISLLMSKVNVPPRGGLLGAGDSQCIYQDVGVLEGNFHAFGVRNEVWRKIPTVELHAFHNF
jgi:hypothetical protein